MRAMGLHSRTDLLPLRSNYGYEVQVQRCARCDTSWSKLECCFLSRLLTISASVLLHCVKRSSHCMRNVVVSFRMNVWYLGVMDLNDLWIGINWTVSSGRFASGDRLSKLREGRDYLRVWSSLHICK